MWLLFSRFKKIIIKKTTLKIQYHIFCFPVFVHMHMTLHPPTPAHSTHTHRQTLIKWRWPCPDGIWGSVPWQSAGITAEEVKCEPAYCPESMDSLLLLSQESAHSLSLSPQPVYLSSSTSPLSVSYALCCFHATLPLPLCFSVCIYSLSLLISR